MKNTLNPLKYLLYDVSGCTVAPALAAEGVISLIISIVLNYATLKVSGFSYESLLRVLVLFLVILGIIHYMLLIIEKLRRKRARLEDIQAANTNKVLKDLNRARTIIDRSTQNGDDVTELRALRNTLTTMIYDVQSPNIEKFKRQAATIEEWNDREKDLVESAEKLARELERSIEVASMAHLVGAAQDAIHSRLPITDHLKDLHNESKKQEKHEVRKLPKGASSEMILYLNTLLTKYATFRPEVLHTGEYFPNAKWEYHAGDKNIAARLSEGSGTPLMIEARWQDDTAIMEVVQKEAGSVKKNQFKCLCLVNSAWSEESREIAARFNHPGLALYLHELHGGLYLNNGNPATRLYEFWFNTEQKRESLNERAMKFVETHEYITPLEIASAFGMVITGAKALLDELAKKGVVTDVSFESDTIRRYSRARKEE